MKEDEKKQIKDHNYWCLAIIFVQLSEGKMVGHLSGLHNELRRANNTVSLSCIFLHRVKWMMNQSCDVKDCL